MRLLKTVHGWLGFFVLPWVLIIGLTGLYLNHEDLVLGLLPADTYDETAFDAFPTPRPMDAAGARALGERLFPGADFTKAGDTRYHGRDAAILDFPEGQVIVALKTGHYWVKTGFQRLTYDPDGQLLETKTYWGSIFKRLHVRGWLSNRLGTWAADITAAAMVVFGVSGIVLFLSPRLRRLRNRRQRRSAS